MIEPLGHAMPAPDDSRQAREIAMKSPVPGPEGNMLTWTNYWPMRIFYSHEQTREGLKEVT